MVRDCCSSISWLIEDFLPERPTAVPHQRVPASGTAVATRVSSPTARST